MPSRLSRRCLSFAQRAVPLVALAAFLAGTIGVPVPRVAFHGKDRSQPYPCMDHECGCASAEQCWKSCCCFTNREKVAWAKVRGLSVPAYVLAAADRERPAVCHSCHHEADCGHEEVEVGSAISLTIDVVPAFRARQCQGQAEFWMVLGAVSVPPAQVAVSREIDNCGKVEILPACLVGISFAPEAPPPRV